MQKTRRMLYTGEPIGAQEAYRLGGLESVVKRDELRAAARELAAKIAGKSPKAMRLAKWSLNGIELLDPKQSYRFEQGFTFELYTSPDSQEARDAFVEKRDARFGDEKKRSAPTWTGLVRIDRETGNPASVADFPGRWTPYRALALSADGRLYSTDENGGVVRFELDSGARETLVPADGSCPPVAMALAGTSLFTDDWCGRLLRIDLDTHAQSVVPTGGPLYDWRPSRSRR